jgi:hypothetical protein
MADIRIAETNWLALRTRALFFAPQLLEFAGRENVGQGQIVEAFKKLSRSDDRLGAPAVRSVFRCQPVVHSKALGVVHAFNQLMESRGNPARLADTAIVASVLKFSGLPGILKSLGLSEAALAASAGISEGFVSNACKGGRCPLGASVRVIDTIAHLAKSTKVREAPPANFDDYMALRYPMILNSNLTKVQAIYSHPEGDEKMTLIAYNDLLVPVREDLRTLVW